MQTLPNILIVFYHLDDKSGPSRDKQLDTGEGVGPCHDVQTDKQTRLLHSEKEFKQGNPSDIVLREVRWLVTWLVT